MGGGRKASQYLYERVFYGTFNCHSKTVEITMQNFRSMLSVVCRYGIHSSGLLLCY